VGQGLKTLVRGRNPHSLTDNTRGFTARFGKPGSQDNDQAAGRHCADVTDPHRDQGSCHRLSGIFALTICVALSAANNWVEIAECRAYARGRAILIPALKVGLPDWLAQRLPAPSPERLEYDCPAAVSFGCLCAIHLCYNTRPALNGVLTGPFQARAAQPVAGVPE